MDKVLIIKFDESVYAARADDKAKIAMKFFHSLQCHELSSIVTMMEKIYENEKKDEDEDEKNKNAFEIKTEIDFFLGPTIQRNCVKYYLNISPEKQQILLNLYQETLKDNKDIYYNEARLLTDSFIPKEWIDSFAQKLNCFYLKFLNNPKEVSDDFDKCFPQNLRSGDKIEGGQPVSFEFHYFISRMIQQQINNLQYPPPTHFWGLMDPCNQDIFIRYLITNY